MSMHLVDIRVIEWRSVERQAVEWQVVERQLVEHWLIERRVVEHQLVERQWSSGGRCGIALLSGSQSSSSWSCGDWSSGASIDRWSV